MNTTRKRRVVVAAAVSVIALLAVIGGYAFWSLGGSGTATTDVGSTGSGAVTLTATIPTGIYPGGTKAITYRASNTNATDVSVGTVSVTGITADTGHATCNVGDFSVAPTAQNVVVSAGASNAALPNTGTLVYANTAVSQDACKGATLTLTLSST